MFRVVLFLGNGSVASQLYTFFRIHSFILLCDSHLKSILHAVRTCFVVFDKYEK